MGSWARWRCVETPSITPRWDYTFGTALRWLKHSRCVHSRLTVTSGSPGLQSEQAFPTPKAMSRRPGLYWRAWAELSGSIRSDCRVDHEFEPVLLTRFPHVLHEQ